VETAFSDFDIYAVIHFAGLKAVGESVGKPLEYYSNNLGSTLVVLEAMRRHNCFNFIFSSSATVYGSPEILPIPESHPLSATNPYGRSKLFIEEMLRDLALSDDRWHIPLLRYFNPVGAHPSGRIGESPNDAPNNLFPCVTQFAVGRRPELKVFGTDYDTIDGSGVRDYLHVCDLAEGHVAALREIDKIKGAVPINLGTGTGYSVLQVVHMFEEVSGKKIALQLVGRRPGDIATCYADATRAKDLLHWEANQTLRSMCEDSWRWQTENPNGYGDGA
jgi:UDP-glucose 4-epimerase